MKNYSAVAANNFLPLSIKCRMVVDPQLVSGLKSYGRGGVVKTNSMQVPKGFSVRAFKGPTLSSHPYTATAKFDLSYGSMLNVDSWQNMERRSSTDPTKAPSPASRNVPTRSNSGDYPTAVTHSRPHPERSKSYPPTYGSFYPSESQDRYIYEPSDGNSLTDDSDSDGMSESAFSTTSLLSTAISIDGTATQHSLTEGIVDTDSSLSSSPTHITRQPFPVQIPALVEAQTSVGGSSSRNRTFSNNTGNSISPQTYHETQKRDIVSGNQPVIPPGLGGPTRQRRDSLLSGTPKPLSPNGPRFSSQVRRNSKDGEAPGWSNMPPPPNPVEAPRSSPTRRNSVDEQKSRTSAPAVRERRDSLMSGAARPVRRNSQEEQAAPVASSSSQPVRATSVPASRQNLGAVPEMGSIDVRDLPRGFVKQGQDASAAQEQNGSRPLPSPPQRRRSDSQAGQGVANPQTQQPAKRAILTPIATAFTRSVRWDENLICPSPIFSHQRRKGWFNRRGDQLWTNEGAYKPPAAGGEFPPDLDGYPEYGEGWMNEEGVRIDMGHRLVPKMPLRSALKRPRIYEQNTELNARIV